MLTDTLTHLGRDVATMYVKAQGLPSRSNSKKTSPRHIIIMFSTIKDKENFESNKREKTYHIRGNPDKTMSKFLRRNLAVLKLYRRK